MYQAFRGVNFTFALDTSLAALSNVLVLISDGSNITYEKNAIYFKIKQNLMER